MQHHQLPKAGGPYVLSGNIKGKETLVDKFTAQTKHCRQLQNFVAAVASLPLSPVGCSQRDLLEAGLHLQSGVVLYVQKSRHSSVAQTTRETASKAP